MDAQLDITDAEALSKSTGHYYYLKVKQRDGELTWSSPVWVESMKPNA